MGQCSFKHDGKLDHADLVTSMSKNNFNFQFVIGRGGFGKVWRVEFRKTKQIFAMKEMSKARIISKRSVTSVMSEKKLLEKLQHPFLVNINYAFQDRENLYLIADLLTGGDLRYHIGKRRRFTERETKFMIACMILGLEYMHNQGVIHRDIKPENIVMEQNGYVRITDMGIAKILKPENSQDTSGTPGYMAPEVMCRQNHSYAVDYFAVGVIGYEFMMGRRPYVGRSRKEIRDMIFAKQVQIKRNELPEGWSLEAADFINKCLQRKPGNRLGLNGPAEVKQHIWLRDMDWQALLEKRVEAPFKPEPNADNFDKKQANKDDHFKGDDPDQMRENTLLLQRDSIQDLFKGYEYCPYGGGQPIPAPLLRKPKDKKNRGESMDKTNMTQGSLQNTKQVVMTTQQSSVPTEKQYKGSVIRGHDQSLVMDQVAQNGPPSQSVNHSRATSLNSTQQIAGALGKQSLNNSRFAVPDAKPHRRHGHNQSVVVNKGSIQTNDAMSDIQSSQSMAVDERQKQRVKKRTFSINSSALMPTHSRKQSKIPTTLASASNQTAAIGAPQHQKNSLSVAHPLSYHSTRPKDTSMQSGSQSTYVTNQPQ